jgi:hypothetical protein
MEQLAIHTAFRVPTVSCRNPPLRSRAIGGTSKRLTDVRSRFHVPVDGLEIYWERLLEGTGSKPGSLGRVFLLN